MDNLLEAARFNYRSRFQQAVADGSALPLVIPYSLLGVFIVPSLWLAIPHTARPWWYQTRWLVVIWCIAFNIHIIRSCSSENLPFSYAAGLMAGWGIIWTLNNLVWTTPQFDAARVVRASRPRQNGESGSSSRNRLDASPDQGTLQRRSHQRQSTHTIEKSEAVEEVLVWQPFPAEGPFLQRLGWALDLGLSFRGAGWNWSVSIVPRPQIPQKISAGDVVDVDAMPRLTRSGYSRSQTEAEFVRRMLLFMSIMYLTIDLALLFAHNDPYFIVGPDRFHRPPAHLLGLPSWLLLAYREIIVVAVCLCYLLFVLALGNVFYYWFLKLFFPAHAILWRHPSQFGSFSQVLDRGLAGWWGGFWHQTFRVGFGAPAEYLIRHGYLNKRGVRTAVVVTCVAFFQSGVLHACGSVSSVPETKPWRPVVYFLLQALGVFTQGYLQQLAGRLYPNPSRAVARSMNLIFTIIWLYLTSGFFVADLASTGATASEPLPISPARWLFSRNANEHWWRWGIVGSPQWYVGRHWWQTGIAL